MTMSILKNKISDRFGSYLFASLFLVSLFILFVSNLLISWGEQHFSLLALSFLHGKLYFSMDLPNHYDMSYFAGHYFWPEGPFPALILAPLTAIIGPAFSQNIIQLILNCFNLYLLFKIAKKITKDKISSSWLAWSFVFATAYLVIGLVPASWWLAQIVTVTLILMALNEFYDKRRWFLIGLWIAFGAATRLTILPICLFFVLQIFFNTNEKKKRKIANSLLMFSPIIVIVGLLGLYNYLRFNSFFETGYKYQILINPRLISNRNIGLWSLKHFPENIYYFLFRTPILIWQKAKSLSPDPWGMSIFLSSPIFLWLFRVKRQDKDAIFALIASFATLLPLLGYYGIGYRQYGYRYALDFYPLLFVALASVFRKRKVGISFKIVAIIAFIFNLLLFPGIFKG